MGKCLFHPGREVTASVAGKSYCAQCEAAQKAARALIDNGVKPKDCFIVYRGGDTWEPIFGTGVRPLCRPREEHARSGWCCPLSRRPSN